MENNQTNPKYKRVLLKLSGEALANGGDEILDFDFIQRVAKVVKQCHEAGVQIGVLCGAGNIWRGRQGGKMNRARADHMGMLATTINALALQDSFEQEGIPACVMTAVNMQTFADVYSTRDAVKALEDGKVVIFGCGTGLPFFSTDTAAALRAAEIEADVILMAKNIDAVYSADPKKDPTATRFEELTYNEMIERDLRALDMTATIFCRDNGIRCYAFGLSDPENIYRVAMGERIGTEIHN
ncbi:MAG: UMP kinase [Clostridia bacterium]|nr:UMP kinase [Clostridia bacterium]